MNLITSESEQAKGKAKSLVAMKKPRRYYLRGHVIGDLNVSVCASTLGMDNSLWNSLTREVSEFVEQVEVLREDGPAGTRSHRVLVVIDRGARARGDRRSLHASSFFKFLKIKVTIENRSSG